MQTLGRICAIVMPIAFIVFVTIVWHATKKPSKRRSCYYCGGDLINTPYGLKCPSCLVIFEDRDNDPMNIS